MKLARLFSGEAYKGTCGYINSQRVYEIIRTILYFSISLSLFFAGWITTKERMNLLTVVAILGCLPASKSFVGAFMFCRFKSTSSEVADEIEKHLGKLTGLYDMVFTGYEKNYVVSHLVVKGDTICGYSEKKDFPEQDFYRHLSKLLQADQFQNVSIKIFTDMRKYTERLDQLQVLDCPEGNTDGIVQTLKSVSL